MTRLNNKHLTLAERNIIAYELNQNWKLTQIAKAISKDERTISKEIRKHMIEKQKSSYNSSNVCKHIQSCRIQHLCDIKCNKTCRTCSLCNAKCSHFEPIVCKRNIRYPYVCNGCNKKSSCRKTKHYYKALIVFKNYRNTLSSSREGIY